MGASSQSLHRKVVAAIIIVTVIMAVILSPASGIVEVLLHGPPFCGAAAAGVGSRLTVVSERGRTEAEKRDVGRNEEVAGQTTHEFQILHTSVLVSGMRDGNPGSLRYSITSVLVAGAVSGWDPISLRYSQHM